MAGFKELLAVEWDQNAVDTFRLNFPNVPVYHGDITKLSAQECLGLCNIGVGELDVLDGSPPCQGFSTAGKRKYDDPRNSLFREYARLLEGMQPRAFVMENVTGMVKGHMKQAYLTIIKTLRECGYKARGEVLNAAHYGVPQSRERVIIIGVRNDLGIEPTHPKPQTKKVSVEDVCPDQSGCRFVTFRNAGGGARNNYSTSKDPLPTIMKSGVDYYSENKTRDRVPVRVLKACATFPHSFQFVGSDSQKIARIGNSVPPNLMRAIAEHVRDNILAKIGDCK